MLLLDDAATWDAEDAVVLLLMMILEGYCGVLMGTDGPRY